MHVREIMTQTTQACHPHDTLERAARLMWEHDCGVVPVVDGENRALGVLTDRDICMGAYTKGRRLLDLHVADAMSRELVACNPDEDLLTAADRMAQRKIRRLPVIDQQRKVCGILSLNDIAAASPSNKVAREQAIKVLAAVCEHRAPTPARAPAAATKKGPAAARS